LFTEEHQQRPSPDYVYGTDKVAAERVIIDSGVEAVLARTGVTVGRNIDNLLVDIFAAPAIVGIKGVDIRYQLIHQDDIGRFFALACEGGPPGPVNVAPPDFVELRRIAEILGKRYVETTAEAALRGIEFMWKHDLVDISPGEAAGISYLPRMATDRLRREWGFECAWSTAAGVVDLRRAVTGLTVVAKRRMEQPWRLRFPIQRPGDAVLDEATARPAIPPVPGELDTAVPRQHPTYTAATEHDGPLPALTLSTHAHVLGAAVAGVLDAFGTHPPARRLLGGSGAAVFGHRLYVNADLVPAVAGAPSRRRLILARAYGAEVRRLSTWAADTMARAEGLSSVSDGSLDAILGAVRDELAWFWAIAAVGAALDGQTMSGLDELVTVLPQGASLAALSGRGARLSAAGRHAGARAQAERVVLALGQTLAAAVRERAGRLVDGGALKDVDDVEHLTWDELVAPPADLDGLVGRRRADHGRLAGVTVPATVSLSAPTSLRVTA